MLVAALSLGSDDFGRLSRFTGVSEDDIARYGKNLRAAGVWTEDGITSCA